MDTTIDTTRTDDEAVKTEQPEIEALDQETSEIVDTADGVDRTRRLVTAALPYINNVPHLGHMVGSHLPADIFARWSRMRGHEVTFIGGSDEFGTPSELAAEKAGMDHKEFCDKLHAIHSEIYRWFKISYDNYSRTGSPKHREIVTKLFKEVMESGAISKKTISMFYDPELERFLADRYIEGTCPSCDFEEASGDQCECCTSVLKTSELKNPRSTLTGKTPELRDTTHLYLDLPAFQEQLKLWIEEQSGWRTQVKAIAMKWINQGLQPRGITRDLKNGIPVPVEPGTVTEGMDDKVLYVWFEAPIAYISFLAEIDDNWEDIWKDIEAGNTEVLHFLGKDNIPFHTVFWPIILMAAKKYRLPTNVVGMQYLNYEGGKFSKSKGRGVFCEAALHSDVDPDMLRVALAQLVPEKSDAEFDWEQFRQSVNSTIVNKLSNFVHRVMKLTKKKLGGEIEMPDVELGEEETTLLEKVATILEEYESAMESVQTRSAMKKVFDLTDAANEYINEKSPWTKDRTEEEIQLSLYFCAYLAKAIATVLSPFAPGTADKIWKQLGLESSASDTESWTNAGNIDSMPKTVQTGEIEMLFKRVTEDVLADIREQLSKVTPLEDLLKD